MQSVRYERQGDVAVVTVDNPPVNALSHAVRTGLRDAIARLVDEAGTDGSVRAAVIVGAGRLFIGGADISEFGRPPEPPLLPDVIAAIEAAPVPVVAAIHGSALGGGLEVALGAHYRIAVPGARLGLPEVSLGLLPGAGGTQRLPRLAGFDASADMITTGKPVDAERALKIGLIDRVAEGNDAREAGLAFAADLLREDAGPRPVRDMPAPELGPDVEARRKALKARARGEVAPLAALDAMIASTTHSFDEGLAEERRLFRGLMETPQRAGLIHAFFAERAVAKLPEIEGVAPREVARVGVIGGGTMGSGIATAALLSGLNVTLVERDAEAAERARKTIAGNLEGSVKRGKIDPSRRDALLAEALETATDYDGLAEADLAIEAVFESMDVKREVFGKLDAVMRPGAILATNTSYLDVDAIAEATGRPADVIGLHFFSPAHVMKLLEVVVAERTAPDVVATAFALAKRMGKVPVRAGVCDGFIGNRILSRYRAAADHMVLDGASPYQVDRALRAFGFPMGPYQVSDLAGLDIGFATRERKAPDAHPRDRRPTFADALFHAGRLGRKSGAGFYDYADDKGGQEDARVEEIVARAREEAGIEPREFGDEEIVARYMAAMVDEATRVVDEGIARRPLDVDVVLVHGYGFPRPRGGPLHWADATGLSTILADIRRFASEDDHFWRASPLLERLAADGGSFADLNKL